MRVDYRKVDRPNDKWRHRLVTLLSLALALALFAAAWAGWLGPTLQGFATTYLVLAVCILGVRAVLTEVGFRRVRSK